MRLEENTRKTIFSSMREPGAFKRALVSAAAAAAVYFGQYHAAMAQDGPQERAPAVSQRSPGRAQSRTFEGSISVGTEIISLINSERVLGEQISPATIAEMRVSMIDAQGVDFTFTMVPGRAVEHIPDVTVRVNYDGTTHGNTGVFDALGFQNLRVQPGESGQATISFAYSEAPAPSRPETRAAAAAEPEALETHPHHHFSGAHQYHDHSLSPFPDEVDMAGRLRHIRLDHGWDIGGNLYANEAGSAVWASIMYRLMGQQTHRPLDLRLDGGNIWFGEQAAPFARFRLRGSVDFWRFRAVYHGSAATIGNLPSQFYTAHSVGLGYSQPLGGNARLRLGAVTGGALSMPAYDDIYFNLIMGASLQVDSFLVYVMPSFYFAAPDPIKTAYVGYYRPQFQAVEAGVQYSFHNDEYTARLFGEWGTIVQRVGVRGTRSFALSRDLAADVWVAGGASHMSQELGGRWDPMVMVGGTIVFGSRSGINSTNTVRYEHLQAGGVRFAETDLPTTTSPGPYGFGRSGDPVVDAQVEQAKSRLLSSSSFSEFSGSYAGSSRSDVLMGARFMLAFIQQVAYANNASNALNNGRFFDSEVRRVAGATNNDVFLWLQRYVQFYNSHDPGTPLPDDLRNGIAVCAGAHWMAASFLSSNGMPAIVAQVNTRTQPHMVTIGMPGDATHLLDWGRLYTTPAGTFDQTLRFYGQNHQAPTFQSQLYRADGTYIGTYDTAEGRLLHNATGIINADILRTEFLGVR